MDSLNIGIDAWIIQDGNYGDVRVGQEATFALEFFPEIFVSSTTRTPSAKLLAGCQYEVCAQIVFLTKEVWVLDMGFLAYQETVPPDYARAGDWVTGQMYLGIDPFYYFEYLHKLPGMPDLKYSFKVERIHLETTPWIATSEESGRRLLKRDKRMESYKEVQETDAWNDDEGHASYVLRCARIGGCI